MPELPEVETTTRGLKKKIIGLTIKNVWTNLTTKDKRQINSVANPKYFILFKKKVKSKKIKSVERQAKNILINLSQNKTILIHMKMTGHLLYGDYKYIAKENKWIANKKGFLKDPYNRYIHFIFIFSNNKYLAFSDMRKFGKITLLNTKTAYNSKHLKNIGPDPLAKNFTFRTFEEKLNKKPNGKIKTILMNQTIVSGIGNIYSDEILWQTNINPERKVCKIKEKEFKKMFKVMQSTLIKSINLGGDSISDYRNLSGEKGKFQLYHKVYMQTGIKCKKRDCRGIIKRKVINGRSAHFCSVHQI